NPLRSGAAVVATTQTAHESAHAPANPAQPSEPTPVSPMSKSPISRAFCAIGGCQAALWGPIWSPKFANTLSAPRRFGFERFRQFELVATHVATGDARLGLWHVRRSSKA